MAKQIMIGAFAPAYELSGGLPERINGQWVCVVCRRLVTDEDVGDKMMCPRCGNGMRPAVMKENPPVETAVETETEGPG